MEYGKLVKCLSKFVAGIVSAAIVFTLVPKILGVDSVSAGEAYKLWIGDVQVTSDNKDDILQDGGKAKYDPDSHTLTLDNPSISGSHNFASIHCVGDLIISGSLNCVEESGTVDCCINVSSDASSGGNLIIDATDITIENYKYGVEAAKSIVISNGNISIKDTKNLSSMPLFTETMELSGGVVNIDNMYMGIIINNNLTVSDGELNIHSNRVGGSLIYVNNNLTVSGGSITTVSSVRGIDVLGDFSLSGGVVEALGHDCGVNCCGIEVLGGELIVNGYYGISAGDITVSGGSVSSDVSCHYGIWSDGEVSVSGGVVEAKGTDYGLFAYNDITISGSSSIVHAITNDSPNCFAIVSEAGTITLKDEMNFKDYEDAAAINYNDGVYIYNNVVCDKNSGKVLTEIKIMKTICTITWKPGDGTGTAITETVNTGDIVYYKDFPDTWTEPSDGRHFDGWLIEGSTIIPHYEYCSGGWTPGVANMYVYEDITCTAKYKYWITGYEDTGDGGIEGIGDLLRGMKPSGSDNCALEGETVEIEIDLKDGFSIADNKIEVLSAGTGKVITSFTVSYHEMSDSMRGTFTMPGEDVTLRFATKDNNASSSTTTSSESSTSTTSTVTAANTYTVVKGGDGEWDGISDYVIEVKSSADDEHCIDRFLWAAVDGHELVVGKECLITKGSTIVTIKSDYLKSLGEGTHNVVVNFKDNSVATTLVVKAAGTQSAASVPATGEGLAPTLFIGGTFVIAAAGFIGIAIMKKRKES